MWRRLFTISAALWAVIFLLTSGIWLRGIFVTDQWSAHRYHPKTPSLESRVIANSNGWLIVTRSVVLLPPGVVPQSPNPMNGTWVHEAGPWNMVGNLPPGSGASLFVLESMRTPPTGG